MIRAIIYALISIFVITFVRMVMGIIMKGMGDLMREESASAAGAAGTGSPGQSSAKGKSSMPTSGEFKACAQCGTYVLASSALTLGRTGAVQYFCTPECRDKHAKAHSAAS